MISYKQLQVMQKNGNSFWRTPTMDSWTRLDLEKRISKAQHLFDVFCSSFHMKKLNGHVMDVILFASKKTTPKHIFVYRIPKAISHGFEVTMFCLTCDKLGVPRPVCVQNDYSLNNRTFDEVPLAPVGWLG